MLGGARQASLARPLLIRVIKIRSAFQRPPSSFPIRLISHVEKHRKCTQAHQHGELTHDRGDDTRDILWEVLLAINGCCKDASDAPGSDDDGGGDSPLGVFRNVIGAVCKHTRDTSRCSGIDEEDPKVADSIVFVVSENEEARYADQVLNGEEDGSLAVFVGQVGKEERGDGREYIRRGGEDESHG